MKSFKRFFTFGGRLFYLEGNVDAESSQVSVYSCYELSLSPGSATNYPTVTTTFTVNSPTMLLPQSSYFPDEAKKKLLADLITDFAREEILAADPNTGPS